MGSCNFKQPQKKEKDAPNTRPRERYRQSFACHGFLFELLDRDLTPKSYETLSMAGAVEAMTSSKKWRMKYLKVHNNVLLYGCNKTKICTGVILLYEADVKKEGPLEFSVCTSGTRYNFRCDKEKECDKWVHALESAVMYTIDDHYDIQDKIGQGSYATVYRAKNLQTDEMRAVKIFDKHNTNLKPYSIRNEVTTLRQCCHKNIIKFYDVIEDMEKIYVVTELAPGQELFAYAEESCLSEDRVRNITKSCLEALEFLHQHKLIHGDLKPENILYDEKTSTIKLVDLGSSKSFRTSSVCRLSPNDSFTLTYSAPEMISSDEHGTGIDMWSIGVTVYVLLSRHFPFRGDCESETYDKITDMEFSFDIPPFKNVSNEAKDFIKSLLCKAEKRMSALEALKHPWIKEREESN